MHKDKPKQKRPPVVAIMGHVDHGKSTLLDYMRKTNVVAGEAGGITQRVSAYEVTHHKEGTELEKITFIDTPGHAAFTQMRERGASIADIAILIVAADDGVNTQTKEAIRTIKEEKIPFVVAINKIDKPDANIERVKSQLMESEVYLEGYGGQISFAEISAKSGKGVDTLLEIILLLAEVENFEGIKDIPATGFVLESAVDPKKGISATLIVKNGTMKSGMVASTGGAFAKVRILEDFMGKPTKEVSFSSPCVLYGFDVLPETGSEFFCFKDKKELDAFHKGLEIGASKIIKEVMKAEKVVPVIVKSDTMGVTEAILEEIAKRNTPNLSLKIVSAGTGQISENDVKLLSTDKDGVIFAFNVGIDPKASDAILGKNIEFQKFDIIYKLTEYLDEFIERVRPKKEVAEEIGTLKVLKTFSRTKERQVVGARLEEGHVALNMTVKIMRQSHEIGKAKVVNLQSGKSEVKEIASAPTECGIMLESKLELAPGDYLIAFTYVIK